MGRYEAQFPIETRDDVITRLVMYAKEGNYCQIIGVPGAGRSHLVGLLAHNKKLRVHHLGEKEESWHFVPVDFSEIRGKNASDAYRLLFFSLLSSLSEREMVTEHALVDEVFRAHMESADELLLSQLFHRALEQLAYERHLTVVLLFDHFEDFLTSAPQSFFAGLVSLQQRLRYHVSVVFFLHRPLESLVEEDAAGDVRKLVAGRAVFLPLRDEALLTYLFAHIEGQVGKVLTRDTRREIEVLCGGHGKLVKVLAEEVLIQEGDVKVEQLAKESKAVRSVLYELWYGLLPKEQLVLKRLVSGEELGEDEQEIATYLSEIGLVAGQKQTLAIPIFADFIAYRIVNKLDDKIVYDKETHEILRGGGRISELLTKSEFRLLSLLLQHPDSIVTRDEIIAAVWPEVKSAAGITDQAIDQMLYRLRKKIEETPDQPYHLHTVKGRGVRFTP